MLNPDEFTVRCLCGRQALRVHCPKCGYHDIYSYARRYTVIKRKKNEQRLKNYRCKRCGEIFTQQDWTMNCNAPPYRAAHRPSKNEPKLDTPEDRQKFIQEFQDLEALRKLP